VRKSEVYKKGKDSKTPVTEDGEDPTDDED
jgi:hypothetical protein